MSGARRHPGLSAPSLLWRHSATDPGAALVVALLVLLGCFLAVATPRAVAALHTAALAEQLAARPASELDLTAEARSGPDPGPSEGASTLPDDVDAVWGAQEQRLRDIRSALPEPLRGATGDPLTVLVADPVVAAVPGAEPGGPIYRIQPGFDPRLREHVRLTEGDWPAAFAGEVPGSTPAEIVLADAVAERLAWAVGERRDVAVLGGTLPVVLSGTVEPVDPEAGFWTHLPTGLRASVIDNGISAPTYTGVAYLDPGSWQRFATSVAAPVMQVWLPIELDQVRATDTSLLSAQLGEFGSVAHSLGSGAWIEIPPPPTSTPGTFVPYLSYSVVGDVGFTSGLRDALVAAAVSATAVDAVLATIASGPVGVVVAVLLLGARVVFERRRAGLELAAARGASPGQLRGILALEGLAIAVPAAIVGAAVGVAAVPGDLGMEGWWIAAVFALVPAALLVSRAPALSPLRRARSDLGGRSGRWRAVLEALVLVLAAVALLLLVRRGVGDARPGQGVDPLLAATPLLLALAACVLVLRLYPLPLGRLVRRMAERPGLVPFLGAARALRDPTAGLVPVLAVVVGVAVAVTSAVLLGTVRSGTEAASAERVGADVAVSGAPFTRAQLDAFEAVPGVEAIAPVYSTRPGRLEVDGRDRTATIVVVSAEELRRVQQGRPDAIDLPAGLDATDGEATPVLVSRPIADFLAQGGDAELDGEPFEVIGVADPSTPFTGRPTWMLMDRENAAPFTETLVPRSVLVRLAPGADAAAAVSALSELAGAEAAVTTADELASELGSRPDARGLTVGLVAAIVISTLLTALAITLTLAVGRPARERLLPLLATLGLGRRGERALVGWEIAPVTVAAVVAGVALGAVVPWIVLAGVDVRTFTGGSTAPLVAYDWPLIGAIVATSIAVSIAAAAVAASVGARASAARATRIEEER
jgi:putative ABC transport system permease protein